jgi:hypothetical protein
VVHVVRIQGPAERHGEGVDDCVKHRPPKSVTDRLGRRKQGRLFIQTGRVVPEWRT